MILSFNGQIIIVSDRSVEDTVNKMFVQAAEWSRFFAAISVSAGTLCNLQDQVIQDKE